jgi:hypothetical protein
LPAGGGVGTGRVYVVLAVVIGAADNVVIIVAA